MSDLLVLQHVIYGLAWLVGALLLRSERAATLLWSGYCALQAAGVWLVAGHGTPGIPVPAMLVMLLGYGLGVAGIDQFVNGRVRHRGLWLCVVGLSAIGLTALQLSGAARLAVALLYNGVLVALLLLPFTLLMPVARREFGRWVWLSGTPLVAMSLATLLRCIDLLRDPGLIDRSLPLAGNAPMLVLSLAAAGGFNLALLTLVIGRLVLRLQRLIETDALTGLANRAGLQQQLARTWQSSLRHGQPLSLAFVDVNRFKQINDERGHEQGDGVLRAVAAALRARARAVDVVGRWGGDEFLVLMPQTDAAGAAQAALRLAAPVAVDGLAEPVSLSVGQASRADGDTGPDALVSRADHAMYRVKPPRAA